MSGFDELLAGSSEQLPEGASKKLTTEVTNKYYTHLAGDYSAIISGLRFHWKDADKKKCDADKPGAVLTGASLRFIIAKDPELQLLTKKEDGGYLLDVEQELGRLTFNHYLSLRPDDQWQHARALGDFTINDMPEANIVQDGGKTLKLQNLKVYVGIAVNFTLEEGKKEGSRYITNILLADHSILTQEKVDRRTEFVDVLELQLKEYADRLEAEREEKKKKSGGEVAETTQVDEEVYNELDGLT